MRKRGEVGIYKIHKKPTMTIVTRAMFVSRLEIYDVIRFVVLGVLKDDEDRCLKKNCSIAVVFFLLLRLEILYVSSKTNNRQILRSIEI